ncbi:hypothetical protein [Arthrobacter sp. 08Y14]|uniref:hypothetical protein n=1 Tax=Arthrobacter sp. 08Y14 TaxID=2058885 RepID=UPI000CE2FAA5|nr:hypothetical protein [Arthrobacter sp. 08Y14]
MNTSTSELEITYQRALSAYPRRWREEQGDEFIGVLLDVARSEHRSTPTASELLNIVGSGLMARAMHLLGRVSRTRRSVLAFTATVLTFYLAVTMMLLGEWGPWVRPGTLRWRPTGQGFTEQALPLGPFTTGASLIYLLLIAAFICTLLQRTALRRSLFLSAAAGAPLVSLAGQLTGTLAPPLHTMLTLSFLAIVALAGTPAATRPGRVLLTAAAVCFTSGGAALAVFRLSGEQALFFYNPLSVAAVDAHTLTLAATALMLAVAVLLLSTTRQLPWTTIVVVLFAPAIALLWSGPLAGYALVLPPGQSGLWQWNTPLLISALSAGAITALILRPFKKKTLRPA